MTGRSLVAALAVIPLLAACQQRTGDLAPVTSVSNTPDSIGGAVIVQRGDSAYSLSRRYNVPLRDLLEVNHLSPPYQLQVGQRLVLPVSRQYIVQRGDTLYGISRMFSADMSELTRLNGLTAPYAVQAGQPLRLPGGDAPGGTAVAQAPSSSAGAAVGGVVASAPVKQVSRGSIQAAELPPPGASASTPAPVESPSQTATVLAPAPGAKPSGAPEVASAAPVYQPGQAPTSLRPPGQKPAVPEPAPAPRAVEAAPVPPPPPAQEVAAAPPPPPKAAEQATSQRATGRLLWPVKGKVISTFGPKPDGLHNDGLNIAASKGTAVVAADNGVVAYAGNELRGFGNLLLVKHSDGFITAYAHLDRIDVERGVAVKRGQAIGTVGQTGSVTSPQLHFELRKGSQAVDPRDRMEPRVSEGASPDGQPGPG
ncbi:murein DD-endopeptidase MepM/ murein hydrolase activator NlpD [Azospirillum sp. OGB3]|uniref:LysM peptidoglycan-binding domain-containing M23 family metallopeptidase n=1 Tax=Azospirillum sp. OGB3 TaxID=2587012 RepID=UPI0017ECA273|nr:murein DD-endopeptidase MepM/ murein hydrolase activator NlpD [Azospirillum sp. OGB3]